ncbi:MAG TPA: hypothetical protein VLC95_10295, partial [Anaerolineae bacterium]|nr:hypothetical protein [Anaerolineae bacterium]
MALALPAGVTKNIDHFTGRTWLLPVVLHWLEGTGERLLIISGGPGTGKSMIMAWLAGVGPSLADPIDRGRLQRIRDHVKAAHFCMAGTGTTDPEAMARSLAEQLLSKVPKFQAALLATLSDRAVVDIDQHVGTVMAGGSVTGINTLNLAGLGEERSFNIALRRPLQRLYENGFDDTILLLVDALDEAVTYRGATDIARLLAKLDDLPARVRVLATTRPSPEVLKHFRGLDPLDLLEDAPPDVDDVRDYVRGRLRDVAEESRRSLADGIAHAAEGNFLYAALVLEDLLPRLLEIGDLAAYPLPKRLPGLYHS